MLREWYCRVFIILEWNNLLLILTDDAKSRGAVNGLMGRPNIHRIVNKINRKTNLHEQLEKQTPRLTCFRKLSFATSEGCSSCQLNDPRKKQYVWGYEMRYDFTGHRAPVTQQQWSSTYTKSVWGLRYKQAKRKTVWYHNLFPRVHL